MLSFLKRLFVGRPLASTEEVHQRLGKPTALAVFASDAISSTAYASEEILLVLVPVAGLAALNDLIPIAIVVAILLTIVVTSYRQTIYAYPDGGGSYVVSRENLGVNPSLVAGSSLLVDYVLTVAVSVSAGIAAITSAAPSLFAYRVELGLFAIALMTLANLRGLKESGRLFAAPTYLYVAMMGIFLGWGLLMSFSGHLARLPVDHAALDELTKQGKNLGTVGLLLLFRAFSSGAVALTGTEAISNGVPAFRPPESKNAAQTLTMMGVILGGYFMFISILAHRLHPTPSEEQTLLSIMGRAVFGSHNPLYFTLQISTFAILILAANTAYADFPRLSSIVARDGFLPRQLANRGDRLVFSNGIVVLAFTAGALIVLFHGDTSSLIPLYAVGVFTGFTLSQTGMVRHHLRLREPKWRRNLVVNAVGAVATFIVLAIIVISKFTYGAWIPVVLIPLIVMGFRSIKHHYERVGSALAAEPGAPVRRRTHTVVVLVGRVHRGVLEAVAYARSLSPDRLMAVSVVQNEEQQDAIHEEWDRFEVPVELHTVYDPYRDLTSATLGFLDEIEERWPDDFLTVVVPEFVLGHVWEGLLHNQSAFALKTRLRLRPNTVVVSVPYHVTRAEAERRRSEHEGAATTDTDDSGGDRSTEPASERTEGN